LAWEKEIQRATLPLKQKLREAFANHFMRVLKFDGKN